VSEGSAVLANEKKAGPSLRSGRQLGTWLIRMLLTLNIAEVRLSFMRVASAHLS
jgi:hypothetical protein